MKEEKKEPKPEMEQPQESSKTLEEIIVGQRQEDQSKSLVESKNKFPEYMLSKATDKL